MSEKSGNAPRPVTKIDAKSIRISTPSPANQDSARQVGASPTYTLTNAKPSGPESPPERRPRDKRRQYSNPLNKQLHDAVKAGDVNEPFTQHDVEQWMSKYNIRKGDGTKYKDGYAANLLYNSLIKEKKTKNRNSKWLHRRKNEKGIYEYWFAD